MRILILGGDGYLGWSTAVHLTANGRRWGWRSQLAIPSPYSARGTRPGGT